MKKINITSLVLVIYLLVMCIIGWPGKPNSTNGWTEFTILIGASLVVILALRWVQIKRMRMRNERNSSTEEQKPLD